MYDVSTCIVLYTRYSCRASTLPSTHFPSHLRQNAELAWVANHTIPIAKCYTMYIYLQRVLIAIFAFLLAARVKVYQEECTHCRTHSNHNSFNHLPTATFYAPVDNHYSII